MRGQRSVTTILFTDIVGSTERAAELGDRVWCKLQAEHHARVRRELRRFGEFVELWKDADPELQPMVEEARAALRRLGT